MSLAFFRLVVKNSPILNQKWFLNFSGLNPKGFQKPLGFIRKTN